MSRKAMTVSEIKDKIKEYEKILEGSNIPQSRRNSASTYLSILRKRIGIKKKKKPKPAKKTRSYQPDLIREVGVVRVVSSGPKTRRKMVRDLWDDDDE